MARITIEISELRKEDAKSAKELREFMEAKLGIDIATKEDAITVDNDVSSRAYLRVLVRKFLHKSGLKERFRPISTGENIVIKRRRKHEG